METGSLPIIEKECLNTLEKWIKSPEDFSSEEREQFLISLRENPELLQDVIKTERWKELINSLNHFESEEDRETFSDLLILLGELGDNDSISEIVKIAVFDNISNIFSILEDNNEDTNKVNIDFIEQLIEIFNLLEFQQEDVVMQILEEIWPDTIASSLINSGCILHNENIQKIVKNSFAINSESPIIDIELGDLNSITNNNDIFRILEIIYRTDIYFFFEVLKNIYLNWNVDLLVEEKLEDYSEEDSEKVDETIFLENKSDDKKDSEENEEDDEYNF